MNTTYWLVRLTALCLNELLLCWLASQFELALLSLVLLQHLPANNHQLFSVCDGCQQRYLQTIRFNKREVYMAVRIHNMVWVMTPCTVVKHGEYTVTSTMKLEAVGSFEMLVHTHDTAWPCIPWEHNINTDCWENFRCHTDIKLIQYTHITMYPKYYMETVPS